MVVVLTTVDTKGIRRMMEEIRQLRERRGPYYERWLRGIVQGAMRTRRERSRRRKRGR
jgi:hypothetical protein